MLCKEKDTCLCMPKAIFSKLPVRHRVLLSVCWPKVHLSVWAWQPTHSNTPFRSRTNSFCTSETLKDRAYNVRNLVLSCCGTCLQIRRGVKLIFILHLIGGASRLIPKIFSKSYFCTNNREAKHQDMQILSSLIGATAWSIFKLCELYLATKNVITTAKCGKLDSENRPNGLISKLLHPIKTC